jgi:DNA-binding PadR family transcriptional regulator
MRGGRDARFEGRAMRHFGGRRAPKGALRESILRLLADQSLNGYQLMTAIAEKTADQWRPSPGAIYPCLSQLVDEGLITAVDADGQKVFELTDAGREAVAGVGEEPWTDGRSSNGRAIWLQFHSLAETVHLAGVTGTPEQVTAIADELDRARKAILVILADTK